jgi:RNA polymerase sigma-70 factor (ECF subfamily)
MTLPLRQSAPPVPDAELVARTAKGDRNALGALYDRHAGRLILLATRLLGARADAEDVVQDLFVGLPEALSSYRDTGQWEAWLRRVVVNLALKRMRSVRRRREDGFEAWRVELGTVGDTDDALVVRRAVNGLPESLRTIVILKVVEGYSHVEIGEVLGISRGASEVRLSRALAELRRTIGGSV